MRFSFSWVDHLPPEENVEFVMPQTRLLASVYIFISVSGIFADLVAAWILFVHHSSSVIPSVDIPVLASKSPLEFIRALVFILSKFL